MVFEKIWRVVVKRRRNRPPDSTTQRRAKGIGLVLRRVVGVPSRKQVNSLTLRQRTCCGDRWTWFLGGDLYSASPPPRSCLIEGAECPIDPTVGGAVVSASARPAHNINEVVVDSSNSSTVRESELNPQQAAEDLTSLSPPETDGMPWAAASDGCTAKPWSDPHTAPTSNIVTVEPPGIGVSSANPESPPPVGFETPQAGTVASPPLEMHKGGLAQANTPNLEGVLQPANKSELMRETKTSPPVGVCRLPDMFQPGTSMSISMLEPQGEKLADAKPQDGGTSMLVSLEALDIEARDTHVGPSPSEPGTTALDQVGASETDPAPAGTCPWVGGPFHTARGRFHLAAVVASFLLLLFLSGVFFGVRRRRQPRCPSSRTDRGTRHAAVSRNTTPASRDHHLVLQRPFLAAAELRRAAAGRVIAVPASTDRQLVISRLPFRAAAEIRRAAAPRNVESTPTNHQQVIPSHSFRAAAECRRAAARTARRAPRRGDDRQAANQKGTPLFGTDADVRRAAGSTAPGPRDLKQVGIEWLPSSAAASNTDLSNKVNSRRPGIKWDQFEANKRLYGTTSNFDENLYTTVLDEDSLTPEQRAEAGRLAAEITQRSPSWNFHMRQERNMLTEDDQAVGDEERFSGVVGTGGLVSNPTGTGPSNDQNGGGKAGTGSIVSNITGAGSGRGQNGGGRLPGQPRTHAQRRAHDVRGAGFGHASRSMLGRARAPPTSNALTARFGGAGLDSAGRAGARRQEGEGPFRRSLSGEEPGPCSDAERGSPRAHATGGGSGGGSSSSPAKESKATLKGKEDGNEEARQMLLSLLWAPRQPPKDTSGGDGGYQGGGGSAAGWSKTKEQEQTLRGELGVRRDGSSPGQMGSTGVAKAGRGPAAVAAGVNHVEGEGEGKGEGGGNHEWSGNPAIPMVSDIETCEEKLMRSANLEQDRRSTGRTAQPGGGSTLSDDT